jgi:A/G-specific adenine glycosylase
MRVPDQRSIRLIRKSLLRWYGKHKRDLAWRSTTDPYKILVSEIMLQQTQVDRVRQKLPLFLERFPGIRSLAAASRADVIRAWQGMGYNNRAVRLREMGKTVVEKYRGDIPAKISSLQRLPGIGPYTANAVACFAFRQRVAVVDVNVRRVLSRLFQRMRTSNHREKETFVLETARRVLPRDAYAWNQALMDLGATICIARKPACDRCPLKAACMSSHLGKSKRATAQSPRKREPSHAGIPNRLWRGKIVEHLRSLDDHQAITVLKLGRSIKHDFQREELRWMMDVVQSLSDDGILTITRAGTAPAVKLADT